MENLIHFFVAGGWVMYPLAFLSVASITIIFERLVAYRSAAHVAPGLLDDVIDLCEERKFEEALKACQGRRGPVALAMATILEMRQETVEDVERNVQEAGEEYFLLLEERLPILDTTTTISPLLGLLGTLFGMIGTFKAIAASKGSGENDSILSGVGEALYATATGLTIAIICFIAYNYFQSRARTAIASSEQAATKLINVLRSMDLLKGQPTDAREEA